MNVTKILEPINNFLYCSTPSEWIEFAIKEENLKILLTDHLVAELKAAQTAMLLMRKYAVNEESGVKLLEWLLPFEKFIYHKEGSLQSLHPNLRFNRVVLPKSQSPLLQNLIEKMILLIHVELHHFYQVLEIMERRNIKYTNITAGRYAKGLLRHVKTHEPQTLIDKLICGAFIEARSCERFAKIAPFLDPELGKFYYSLLRSEAGHFDDYIQLAQTFTNQDISERVAFFGKKEADLILSPDADFKFHSGTPL